MKEKYQFHYVETQEVLTDFLKVNGMTKLSNNYRIVVAMGCGVGWQLQLQYDP